MRVLVLYDSRALEGYRPDWGFACLVEAEERILFDTGADPAVLGHNMRAAGLAPRDIDKVVISHDHWDHTGGRPAVTSGDGAAALYLLESAGPAVRAGLQPSIAVRIVKEPGEVSPGVHTTGPVGRRIPEQALWLDTAQGVVLICACAHPGLDAILYVLGSDKPLHGVLGGLHGFRDFELLKGVPLVAPGHCTQFRKNIAQRFPDAFQDAPVGAEFVF